MKCRSSVAIAPLLAILFASAIPCSAQIIINEVMFDPPSVNDTTGAEYVELLNIGSNVVPVAGLALYDGSGRRAVVADDAPELSPGAFLLLASDSTIYRDFPMLRGLTNVHIENTSSFSLNNSGDLVVIRDADGLTLDSLAYDDDWHWDEIDATRGISLERISSTTASNQQHNWSSSVNSAGGTPAHVNSRSIPPSSARARLELTPTRISPDGDGYEDFMRIAWELPSRTSRVIVDLYDRQGALLVRIASNMPSGSGGEVIWDGRDRNDRPLPVGLYILRLEAYDSAGAGLISTQRSLVVAGDR